ncbi:hypothetical protein [Bacteroides fragilis]|uniref:hypothetical protein n=2 Tax=Bacteroides fragilis TaxID=817 RepID=UPI001E2BF78C|nr:hypothetical protein [Bacteroides fragilis]
MIRKKGKAGKGNVHLIILYRGNLSGRGKRGIVAKGRERRCRREGNLPRKGGKGAFRGRERDVSGKGKRRFGEENRGGNWDRERDKLKSRRRIEGRWTGIERKLSRDQTGIKRKSNKNGTESCVNIVNAIGETFISEMERTKLLLLKDLFFEDKRLVLTVR